MNENRLAVVLLTVISHIEYISLDELEERFEKFDKRYPGLVSDFDIEAIERICNKHPFELKIQSEAGNPFGIKRGELWSSEISRIEIEKYCSSMSEQNVKSLKLF